MVSPGNRVVSARWRPVVSRLTVSCSALSATSLVALIPHTTDGTHPSRATRPTERARTNWREEGSS